MNPDPIKYPFSFSWDEMDVPAFSNMREWLTKACEAAGAQWCGGGIGFGAADIQVLIDGAPFEITIRPLPIGEPKGHWVNGNTYVDNEGVTTFTRET